MGTERFSSPFRSLAEASSVGPPGRIVLVASGTYDEPPLGLSELTIRGTCTDAVVRTARVDFDGPSAALENLTLSTGAVVVRGRQGYLFDVILSDAVASPLVVEATGEITMLDTVVRRAAEPIHVEGSLSAQDVNIEDSQCMGLESVGGSVLLERTIFRGTRPCPVPPTVDLRLEGGDGQLSSVRFDGGGDHGVAAYQAILIANDVSIADRILGIELHQTDATLTNLAMGTSRLQASSSTVSIVMMVGRSLDLETSHANIRQLRLEGDPGEVALSAQASSEIAASDLLIRNALHAADVLGQAHLQLQRAEVAGSTVAFEVGSGAVAVRDASVHGGGTFLIGPADVTVLLERVAVSDVVKGLTIGPDACTGPVSLGSGQVTVSSLKFQDTANPITLTGATANLVSVELERSGSFWSCDSRLDATDLSSRSTTASIAAHLIGISGAPGVQLARVSLQDAGVGLELRSIGTDTILQDVVIEGARDVGLRATGGGSAQIARLGIVGCPIGLDVEELFELDLKDLDGLDGVGPRRLRAVGHAGCRGLQARAGRDRPGLRRGCGDDGRWADLGVPDRLSARERHASDLP